MFGDHFYHAILRKTVAVFGTMFNNISVVRKDSAGIVKDVQKVPLAYGPKQKFLARLDDQADLNDPKIAIKLPRMSFEITNMAYDSATKISQYNQITQSTTTTTRTSIGQITPYIVDMQLNILAKNQDDALQIVEQILPYFQPTYTLAVKFVEGLSESFDVPITLTGINVSDDYEGDMTTRRVLVYTLDFSMKVKFFGPAKTSSVIDTVAVDINNMASYGFLEEVAVESDFTIVQATATAGFLASQEIITTLNMTNRGRGYTTPPDIVIALPTLPPAKAVISGVVDSGTAVATITTAGRYYLSSPTITISGLRLVDNVSTQYSINTVGEIQFGRLVSVTIPEELTSGVLTIDSITATDPTGTAAQFGATAVATVADGRIDTIAMTSYGGGYAVQPVVTIAAPSGSDATFTVYSGVDQTDDDRIS